MINFGENDACFNDTTVGMKNSTQVIEWLRSSKFSHKTPINHMFWVDPTDMCRRSDGREQTIGDLCAEIREKLRAEFSNRDSGQIQDWYMWDYRPTQEEIRCVFTQMPPLEESVFQRQSSSVVRLGRIKELLPLYKKEKKDHHTGKIYATDGFLSWRHNGTGLQWATFSYLQSQSNDHADILNQLCYAGYTDWRVPTISDIRTMFSADKEMQESTQHPLAGTLPRVMPLPVEVTPKIHPSAEGLQGYYVFRTEETVTTGYHYNRSDEKVNHGGSYTGRFLAVRGERKLQRNFQTGWAGTLLAWTEKNMSLVEQGQLPGSSAGWKRLERLILRGTYFSNGDCAAALSALRYLDNLKEVSITVDEVCQEIPEQFFQLSQIKRLNVYNGMDTILDEAEADKWSISHISPKIAHMTCLEGINFSWQMELTVVPDEIFDLPNLTSLQFGGCWNLVLSMHQVQRICELAEAGVSVNLSTPLKLHQESDRMKLIQAVEENGGEIDWAGMKELAISNKQ